MPNYIVLNSKFKPFSFEEILKPSLLATQEHQALDQAYSELNQQAAPWENRINQLRDPISYNMYNEFSNKLLSNVEQLAKEGLNSSSRRALFQTNADYKNKIVPIENAYNSRIEDLKNQRELLEKDSTAMFSLDIGSTSVDDYLNGNRPQYNTVYGSEILERSSDLFDNFKNQLTNVSNWQETAQGRLLERIETKGFTRQDLVDILNNPESYPDINYLMKNILSSSGVNYLSPRDQQKAYQFLIEGMASGLGTSNIDTRVNTDRIGSGSGNGNSNLTPSYITITTAGSKFDKASEVMELGSEKAKIKDTEIVSKYPEYNNLTKSELVKINMDLDKEIEYLSGKLNDFYQENSEYTGYMKARMIASTPITKAGDKAVREAENKALNENPEMKALNDRLQELYDRRRVLNEGYATKFQGLSKIRRAFNDEYKNTSISTNNFSSETLGTYNPEYAAPREEQLINFTPNTLEGNKAKKAIITDFMITVPVTGKNKNNIYKGLGIQRVDEFYNPTGKELTSIKDVFGTDDPSEIEKHVLAITEAPSNIGPEYVMVAAIGDKGTVIKSVVPTKLFGSRLSNGLNVAYGSVDKPISGIELYNQARELQDRETTDALGEDIGLNMFNTLIQGL